MSATVSSGTDTESRRAACEARYWLRVTKGKRAAVEALMARISARRGKAAANKLREAMRHEYRQEAQKPLARNP